MKTESGKKAKKAIKIALEIVAGALIVFVLVVFLLAKVNGKPIFVFGKTTMWVMTGSMDPTIPARTYIVVEKVDPADVEVGDIVAFVSTDPQIAGMINTHRVVGKTAGGFLTKGDANGTNDTYPPKDGDIVGRYVKTLPVMTFVGRLVTSQIGFPILIALFLALTAACYLPDIKKALQEREKEEKTEKQKEIDRRVEERVREMIEADRKKKGDDHA